MALLTGRCWSGWKTWSWLRRRRIKRPVTFVDTNLVFYLSLPRTVQIAGALSAIAVPWSLLKGFQRSQGWPAMLPTFRPRGTSHRGRWGYREVDERVRGCCNDCGGRDSYRSRETTTGGAMTLMIGPLLMGQLKLDRNTSHSHSSDANRYQDFQISSRFHCLLLQVPHSHPQAIGFISANYAARREK